MFWGLPGTRFDGARVRRARRLPAAPRAPWSASVRPAVAAAAGALEVDDAQQALVQLGRLEPRAIRRPGGGGDRQRRQDDHAADDPRRAASADSRGIGQPEELQQPRRRAAAHAGDGTAARLCRARAGGERRRRDRPAGGTVPAAHRRDHANRRRPPGRVRFARAVAAAKTELLAALPTDGWAVLAGDDPRLRRMAAGRRAKIVWFGRSLDNDLVATNVESRDGRLDIRRRRHAHVGRPSGDGTI